jgi:hypothetical protein
MSIASLIDAQREITARLQAVVNAGRIKGSGTDFGFRFLTAFRR